MASELNMVSSMATRQVLAELVARYTRDTGVQITVESVGGVDAARRVRAGEAFDVVVLAANAIDALVADGKLVGASRVDLMRSGVAVAVEAGASRPDVASEEAVKRAVLGARSLSYSTGPSGVHLMTLFERWGIAEAIKGRIVQAPPGVPVGTLIAEGKVELGFQQLSELIHLPGIDVLGPLPPAIQTITMFAAARTSASAHVDAVQGLLRFLASPLAADAKLNHGMEPA